jgi:flagellar biosynthesis/type III secretory pathway M-ring protein FliF/YscJ
VEQLRQAWANVRQWLGKMRPAQIATLGGLAVAIVLFLVVISQQFGKPAMVELYPGATAADQQQWSTHLATMGIKSEIREGKVHVPSASLTQARGAVSQAGLLPNDKAILYENILRQQNWTNSRQQNEQLFNNALENELARTIERFNGVKGAKVFIDAPPAAGLGQSVRRPTASVWAITQTGQSLSQGQVDAIAGLVSGSKAGLTFEQIRVVDGASGRQRKASSEDDAMPTTYLEHALRVEAVTREKIGELLSFIPGVVVAVTAQVDVTRVQTQTDSHLPVGQGTQSLPSMEETTETTQASGGARAAEPGVRANQAADITFAGGGGNASNTSSNQSSTQYENHVGVKRETTVDPRGFPTMVAVSINVPRGFVVRMLKSEKDGAAGATPGPAGQAADPTEEEVAKAFEERVKPTILASVTPQVRALTMQSNRAMKDDELKALVAQSVGVSLIPMDLPEVAVQSGGFLSGIAMLGGGGGGGSGGGGLLFGGGIVDTALLALLSVGAIGMMLMLVKKGGKTPKMPTAEELVGLPPPIEGTSEIVGEADEGETAMAGIEVGEGQMQSQKMLEQVSEMVSKEPEAVARMLNRWVVVEE